VAFDVVFAVFLVLLGLLAVFVVRFAVSIARRRRVPTSEDEEGAVPPEG
jgi:hypothetical protein